MEILVQGISELFFDLKDGLLRSLQRSYLIDCLLQNSGPLVMVQLQKPFLGVVGPHELENLLRRVVFKVLVLHKRKVSSHQIHRTSLVVQVYFTKVLVPHLH